MLSPETKSYEDLKNNESIQLDNNLKNLIKEIDEIKDTTNKDNDKIEGVFVETPEGQAVEKVLNQNLLDSLNKLDTETIQILVSETDKLYNDISLQLSDDVKNSLKDLYQLLMQIVNEKNIENNVSELNANHPIERDIEGSTNVYQTIEGIGHIEGRNVIIEAEEKTDNGGKTYIDINGEPCYKYYDKMTGFGYSKEIYNRNIGCFYRGYFKEGKREGKGTMIYGNGYKYEGGWSKGKIHGKGDWTYPNGNKFTGTFENGAIKESMKKGEEGVVTINSQEYKVVIKNNKMIIIEPRNYRDKMIDPNKDDGGITEAPQDFREIKGIGKFEDGEFIFDSLIKQGKDHQGKYIELGGSRYHDHEDNKNLTGTGYECDFYDGNFYVGNFKNGKYENRGQFFCVDGTKYVGNFKDGERQGKGTLTFSDGTKFEGNFEEGKFVQGKITAKIDGTEKTYDVVKYGKIWKITSGSEKGKFLKRDENNHKYDILNDALDNAPNKIDGIGHIEGNKIIFDNIVEQTDDSGKNFIEVNGKKYNEYSDGMSGLGYRTGIDYFYLGNFSDGNYNGEGTLISSDGYKYEGNFKGGYYDGKGTLTFSDGKIYDGNFEKGKRQGEGTMIYGETGNIFTGQWKDNKMQKGKFTLKSDGTEKVYNVERTNDLMKITSGPDSVGKFINQSDGKTILDIPLGASSVEGLGYFKDGNFTFFSGELPSSIRLEGKSYRKYKPGMNGNGFETGITDQNIGYLFLGNYKNGRYDGKGKMYWSNGDLYEGSFKDGDRQGQGIYTFSNGEIYDCRGKGNGFKDGSPYKGTFTRPEGKITNFKGTFDGRSPKRGITILKDNRKYTGAFKDWEMTGKGKMTYDNGLILDGNFNDGQLIKGTAIISGKKYNVEKDDKGLKITSPGENNGKYVVEASGKVSDWNVNINDDNLKNIFNINDLDIGQANAIQELRDAGMDININNISDICKLRNPEKGGELDREDLDILRVDSKGFGEGYDYSPEELQAHYNYKRGRIIETIQTCVQNVAEYNNNPENLKKKQIGKFDIRDKIRGDLVTLPREERLQILIGINEIVKKFSLICKYIDFDNGPYKNAKELVCGMQGITDPKIINAITDEIEVKQHGLNFAFFIPDFRSFQIVYDKSLVDSGECNGVGGWSIPGGCTVPELNGTLTLINGKDPGTDINNYNYGLVRHEGQHNWNSYFMPDKSAKKPITRAKDEITAYLRDGRGTLDIEKWGNTIEQMLIEPKSHGGIYQYIPDGPERDAHVKKVKELLGYAKDLILLTKEPNPKLKREFVISVLADTPAEGWKDMHDIIMDAANNGLSIDSHDFWRAGTAEPEAAINEISLANSIEEIKHILKDPKYSHISRDPNHKGGIEVSAIIDEYLAGKLSISFIPPEIRQQVQKFINQ